MLLLSLSFSPLSLTLTFNLTSSLLPPATHLQTAGNNYGLSGLCGLQMADKRKGDESGQSIRAELRMSNGNLMGGMGFQEAAATRCAEGHVKCVMVPSKSTGSHFCSGMRYIFVEN